jgi:hypothetical protein
VGSPSLWFGRARLKPARTISLLGTAMKSEKHLAHLCLLQTESQAHQNSPGPTLIFPERARILK